MKITLALAIIFLMMPIEGFAQKKKKSDKKQIYVSSQLSFYPYPESYNETRYGFDHFIIPVYNVTEENIFPSSLFNIGASVQIINEASFFHEFSLTRFSRLKRQYKLVYHSADQFGAYSEVRAGHTEKSLSLTLRYEYGKFFGEGLDSKIRFGLSGSIEPSLFFFNRIPATTLWFPFRVKSLLFDLAINPICLFTLSKRVSLGVKLTPNLSVANFGTIRTENPNLTIRQQTSRLEYDLFKLSFAGTLQVRYLISELNDSKRSRRR